MYGIERRLKRRPKINAAVRPMQKEAGLLRDAKPPWKTPKWKLCLNSHLSRWDTVAEIIISVLISKMHTERVSINLSLCRPVTCRSKKKSLYRWVSWLSKLAKKVEDPVDLENAEVDRPCLPDVRKMK
jgi:hypothetical protein